MECNFSIVDNVRVRWPGASHVFGIPRDEYLYGAMFWSMLIHMNQRLPKVVI